MKKIAILGSTGSIGTQALDIIERNPDMYQVSVLSCASRTELLRQQIRKFSPEAVVLAREADAAEIGREFPRLEVWHGRDGLIRAAQTDCDLLLNALMGMRGLPPTYAACLAGRTIAFANKETLVAGGQLIMETAAKNGARLLPVDSEHSAIFQCLEGNGHRRVRRILLTGSGGPFRGFTRAALEQVTLQQALQHPRWTMGKKITIDSATLMNKGLEIIEARWLFDIPQEQIEVVIHPQSVIHSMVEFCDTAVIAQLGQPDMRVPISFAFSWPQRLEASLPPLDFPALGQLTFEAPDPQTFRCLEIAREAARLGGSYPVVMNAANEELVAMFLTGQIRFLDIPDMIERIMSQHVSASGLGMEEILGYDEETREKIKRGIR